MYVWIWRTLPGNWFTKLLGSLLLFLGVCALLFFFVFPWVEPQLPWNHVTVHQGSSTSGTVSP